MLIMAAKIIGDDVTEKEHQRDLPAFFQLFSTVFLSSAYICTRQVLHDQLLLNPPRSGRKQE
jgi:hypothetical protein